MAWEEGVSKIKSRLTNLKYSVSSNDLKTALNIAHRYADFEQKPLILNGKFQENMVGVKGIITGPTTLVLSSRLDGFYSRDRREQAIMDLALILKKEVKLLENAGASVIQVDEPFLSTGMADINTAHKAIEILGQDLQIPLAMHVCGDLRGVLQDLLNFPIDILDCEFAGNNTNLPLLEIHKLGDKKIGFGCIDTTKENVESADDIIKLVEKGIDIIGAENMIIDPDCGMRNLKEETAYNKLKNMTEAVRWLS
jgi:5-methyltetrahydropteroyltriglutamate--homocysteine methyltransferase